jgi:hypothetical protein
MRTTRLACRALPGSRTRMTRPPRAGCLCPGRALPRARSGLPTAEIAEGLGGAGDAAPVVVLIEPAAAVIGASTFVVVVVVVTVTK